MLHHGAGLRAQLERSGWTGSDAGLLVEQLSEDWTGSQLVPLDRGLLEYAVKLTQTPEQISEIDISALREAGLNDRAIHDLAAIVGYFNFVNRVASGLGVELEPRFRSDPESQPLG